MNTSRRALAGSLAAATLLLGACTAGAPPGPTATASASAAVDFTRPGAARQVVDALLAAAGATSAIKVEITQTNAQIVVVDGQTAKTWAWRDGKATPVDGDVQFIGQAAFRPADYAFDDVGALFQRAAQISRSKNPPELQIVEYTPGKVYMTVTTSPESTTVFFTPQGTVVQTLDFATADGIRAGLDDAVGDRTLVWAIGIAPATGISVDAPNLASPAPGETPGYVRSVRAPKYPTRTEIRTDKPAAQLPFDPRRVDPDVLGRLIAQYQGPNRAPVTFAIDRRDGLSEPTIRVVADGRTVICDLAGNDITAVVKR